MQRSRIISLGTLYERIIDDATRLLTRGEYSHCEIAIARKDGSFDCYSASNRDDGVRHKVMRLPAERWVLIAIDADVEKICAFYRKTQYAKYDWFGAFGLFLPFRHNESRYFCSEWCWEALGGEQGWRLSPNDLAVVLQKKSGASIMDLSQK